MRVIVLLLLTTVSVWGLPQKRTAVAKQGLVQPSLPQIVKLQATKGSSRRETFGKLDNLKGKCATSIAQKAAAEAKAAQQAQNAAGAQAAHMVKTQLAEKALQAAKAAEAALAGKQAVVEQLQQEVKEAEAVVAENTAAVHQQQGTVNAAIQQAQQSTALHKFLGQAAQKAYDTEIAALDVLVKAKEAQEQLSNHLSQARARLARLQLRLKCACKQCAVIKAAAHSACDSAGAATRNLRRKRNNVRRKRCIVRWKTSKRVRRRRRCRKL